MNSGDLFGLCADTLLCIRGHSKVNGVQLPLGCHYNDEIGECSTKYAAVLYGSYEGSRFDTLVFQQLDEI